MILVRGWSIEACRLLSSLKGKAWYYGPTYSCVPAGGPLSGIHCSMKITYICGTIDSNLLAPKLRVGSVVSLSIASVMYRPVSNSVKSV